MFFKKKELVPYDCFENKVKCETCKFWLDKKDAQEVKVTMYLYYFDNVDYRCEYYCPTHKKGYKERYAWQNSEGFFNNKYYKQVEVDEKGNVIKQK